MASCVLKLGRAFATCAMLSVSVAVSAQNPYLPLWEHIPDSEPYVFEDPDRSGHQRVYILFESLITGKSVCELHDFRFI